MGFQHVEDKAAFTLTGGSTDLTKFNGDCNKGLSPAEVLEKWEQTSRKKKTAAGAPHQERVGVLTGPINGGLLAVDIDGEDAESVLQSLWVTTIQTWMTQELCPGEASPQTGNSCIESPKACSTSSLS